MDWYSAEALADVDVLITMLDAYDLSKALAATKVGEAVFVLTG